MSKFAFLLVSVSTLLSYIRGDCWDTACQPESWVGCKRYNMIEINRVPCDGGYEYSCCSQTKSENNQLRNSEDSKPKVKQQESEDVCWDTGCQSNSWAVTGCEQYDMVEINRSPCDDGFIYSCCGKKKKQLESSSGKLNNQAKRKCWDTGCQLNSWAVTGCEQYDMIEVKKASCDNGFVYSCCNPEADKQNISSGTLISSLKLKPETKQICWDTGCQLSSWAVKGCDQYDMTEIKRVPCNKGHIYSCCKKDVKENIPLVDTMSSISSLKAKPKCWDTGCQSKLWAVTGCEQYDMVEVKRVACEEGFIYSCCGNDKSDNNAPVEKNKPKEKSSSHTKKTCWDTGCQLDSWAVKGCEQYDMVEVKRIACDEGFIYSCCGDDKSGNGSTIEKNKPKEKPSNHAKKTCWDTGCQLDSWAVKGCEQYDMVEVKRVACDEGFIYSCCTDDKSGNDSTVEKNKPKEKPNKTIKKKCWDTGCQLDSWAVKGCEQYDMVETKRLKCDEGFIYSCCEKENTSVNSSTEISIDIDPRLGANDDDGYVQCWGEGCPPNSNI